MSQSSVLKQKVEDLMQKVDTTALINRSVTDWRPILCEECGCYVFSENYLCKRFDQINYKFCAKDEAKEILIDNLYALLRFKYFSKSSEEVDQRIDEIIKSFTANLKTTLKKVSFDKSSNCSIINMIPDYCVAFRNGVYDFKNVRWFFKYDIIDLQGISNKIYLYDDKYVIQWYLDYEFEPLDIDVINTPLKEFIDIMKDLTKSDRNYCFELLYNIAHDSNDKINMQRFYHLCEILGYTVLQSFSQYFVLLIGSGQNGKNSLFDGCFSNRVFPRPASNDLDTIENDRFITGALENRYHNIFLETSAKTYTESKMLKALTGSMYQTIEQKGISKYSGVINCKHIFAGNDQDKIKFADTTVGFRRRINMFEIWYRWDSQKSFLKKGDYYDTTFSDSLSELKDNVLNTTAYVYFAMYGIVSATNGFTQNFKFTDNDWNYKYTDVDLELKDKIEQITPQVIYDYLKRSDRSYEEGKVSFYDMGKTRLQNSTSLKNLGYKGYDDMLKMFENSEESTTYFVDHDIYMSVRLIQGMIKDYSTATAFTQTIKKTYGLDKFEKLDTNKPFVKCAFINQKLRILK